MAIILTSQVPEAGDIPFDGTACTPSITATDVAAAICETHVSAIGALIPFQFESTGNTADKWLGYSNSASPSDDIPFVLPQDMEVKGYTFSNADDDVDTNVEFYVNGTLTNTWQIRNKRWAYDVGATKFSVSQGDRVSVFMDRETGGTGDSTAQDPIVTVFCKFVSETPATGGAQNGVT